MHFPEKQKRINLSPFRRELLDSSTFEKNKVIAEQEKEIATKDQELEQEKAKINTLQEEVQEHENYITEMEEAVDSLDVTFASLSLICYLIFAGNSACFGLRLPPALEMIEDWMRITGPGWIVRKELIDF